MPQYVFKVVSDWILLKTVHLVLNNNYSVTMFYNIKVYNTKTHHS